MGCGRYEYFDRVIGDCFSCEALCDRGMQAWDTCKVKCKVYLDDVTAKSTIRTIINQDILSANTSSAHFNQSAKGGSGPEILPYVLLSTIVLCGAIFIGIMLVTLFRCIWSYQKKKSVRAKRKAKRDSINHTMEMKTKRQSKSMDDCKSKSRGRKGNRMTQQAVAIETTTGGNEQDREHLTTVHIAEENAEDNAEDGDEAAANTAAEKQSLLEQEGAASRLPEINVHYFSMVNETRPHSQPTTDQVESCDRAAAPSKILAINYRSDSDESVASVNSCVSYRNTATDMKDISTIQADTGPGTGYTDSTVPSLPKFPRDNPALSGGARADGSTSGYATETSRRTDSTCDEHNPDDIPDFNSMNVPMPLENQNKCSTSEAFNIMDRLEFCRVYYHEDGKLEVHVDFEQVTYLSAVSQLCQATGWGEMDLRIKEHFPSQFTQMSGSRIIPGHKVQSAPVTSGGHAVSTIGCFLQVPGTGEAFALTAGHAFSPGQRCLLADNTVIGECVEVVTSQTSPASTNQSQSSPVTADQSQTSPASTELDQSQNSPMTTNQSQSNPITTNQSQSSPVSTDLAIIKLYNREYIDNTVFNSAGVPCRFRFPATEQEVRDMELWKVQRKAHGTWQYGYLLHAHYTNKDHGLFRVRTVMRANPLCGFLAPGECGSLVTSLPRDARLTVFGMMTGCITQPARDGGDQTEMYVGFDLQAALTQARMFAGKDYDFY